MAISQLPTAPSRRDPGTFSERADAFVEALLTFVDEANQTQTEINTSETNAANSATDSANSAMASANSAAELANLVTAAATSETNAANSATAAATSETNAANSATTAGNYLAQFGAQYLGPSATQPTTDANGAPLTAGAFYFDTNLAQVLIYNGSYFDPATATVNGTSQRQQYTATQGQTNFAINYDAPFVDVFMNGVKLVRTVDYLDTSGTEIVLTQGTADGDILDIVAYGSFKVENVLSQSDAIATYLSKTEAATTYLPSAGGTVSGSVSVMGDVTANGNVSATDVNATSLISGDISATRYVEHFVTLAGSSPSVDTTAGNKFGITLSSNTTFSFVNPPASGKGTSFTLTVIQDSTARSITWPSAVRWPGGTAPDLSSTSGAHDIFVFQTYDGGANWYGAIVGQDFQ